MLEVSTQSISVPRYRTIQELLFASGFVTCFFYEFCIEFLNIIENKKVKYDFNWLKQVHIYYCALIDSCFIYRHTSKIIPYLLQK